MILRKKELIFLCIVGNYLSELLIKGYLLWLINYLKSRQRMYIKCENASCEKRSKASVWLALVVASNSNGGVLLQFSSYFPFDDNS